MYNGKGYGYAATPQQGQRNARLEHIESSTDIPISANVSPGLHPGQLANFGPVLVDDEPGPGVQACHAARNVMRSLYDGLTKMDNAHKMALRPVEQIPAFKAKGSKPIIKMEVPKETAPKLNHELTAAFGRVAASTERGLDVFDQSIAQLNESITKATTHPHAERASMVQLASEIRAYISRLPEGA